MLGLLQHATYPVVPQAFHIWECYTSNDMLARSSRLHADRDYARLFAKGRAFHGRGVTVKALKSKVEKTKIGFVVSTKVAKKANVRNLIKRRLREIVRKRLADLQPGVDVAVIAKIESKDMTFAELKTSLEDILWKSGLLIRK